MISIVDLKSGSYFKRMRQLGFEDLNSEEFTMLCFNSDARLLTAVSGGPDFIAIVWDWLKEKMIAKYQLPMPITRISFNPKDS